MPTTFYSPLRSIVPVDALPDALGFVKDGLASLLDDVYFKDLQSSKNARGDAANYSLSLVSLKPLEIEIPGTGIFLILNPGLGEAPGATSEFPVTLSYEWSILAWLRELDLGTFSFTAGDFFQLALSILQFSERQLLERALALLPAGEGSIGSFVDEVNAFYGTAIAHPTSADPIGEVLTAIDAEPGLENCAVLIFSLYVLDPNDAEITRQRLDAFFGGFFGGSVEDYLKKLLVPKIDATLGVGVGLKFPRNVLEPLDEIAGEPLPEPARSLLSFDAGDFYFSTERGIGYDRTLTASLTPSRIGKSGFELEITEAKLDLSRQTNIPEATADGRSEDFVGVFIPRATLKLPPVFNHDADASSAAIVGRNLLIGTGGLSGRLALEAKDPDDPHSALVRGRFGSGFELGLAAIEVAFQQNAIIGSTITGFMKIPALKDTEGNDAEVTITVSIGTDGEFSVTAAEEQGLRALRIPDVLEIAVKSLAVGAKEGRFFAAIAGSITFLDQGGAIGQLLPEAIEIEKLLVWEDGKLELEGGGLTLADPVSLKVGPVEMSITAVHFGAHEQDHEGQLRQYQFWGFDGGLSIAPGGVDARGDGIKLYYTTDNGVGKPLHVFLRIQSIAIDMILPGGAKPEEAALLLKGFLAMKDAPGGGSEYQGGVAFSLPKLKLAGSAAMRYDPRLPSFLIDAGLELSSPIVLGATGLGIYGFRGLVGMRWAVSKSATGLADDAEWWQYYKAKVAPDNREGIQLSKFAAQEGFALGAGISLATVPDAGRAFSSKLFFLLSLPDVLLLQGQGQVLKKRIGLDTTEDPPFFALIAITSTSIETAFGVDYKVPDDGKIAKVNGLLEMGFFFQNSGAWYVNLGKDTPEERRISARLLTLFNSYFYMMLSSGGIRAGAGVCYELKKKIGPFQVELVAFLDVAGQICFVPRQIGASVVLGGSLGLTIFGFGFHVTAAAGLTAEAPRPFTVTGRLEACVDVLWSKRCVTINLTWTFDNALDTDEIDIVSRTLGEVARAVHMLTGETFALHAARTATLPAPAALEDFILPMDCFLDFELAQGVKPTGSHPSLARFEEVSGAPQHTVLVPPQKAKSSQVRHQFLVESIEIFSFDPSAATWRPYDVYAAATPLQLAEFVTADLDQLPWGYWQKMHPALHNRLRILSQTPFSYLRQGSFPPPPEDLGVSDTDIFCAPEPEPKRCRDFSGALDKGEKRRAVEPDRWRALGPVLYKLEGAAGELIRKRWQGFDTGLCVPETATIRLLLPAPMACVTLLLQTDAESAVVRFYGRVPVKNPNGNAPLSEWVVWEERSVAAAELEKAVVYENLHRPVLRVDVRGGKCSKPTGGKGGSCRVCLYEICYLSVLDALHNDGLPSQVDVEQAADAMMAGLSGSIQPIWRPDTRYAIRLATRDEVFRHDDNAALASHANTYVFGFRTVGPIGHFHKFPGQGGATHTLPAYAALETEHRADQFRLAGLLHYLDLPKCYPNADGRLTNAKPLFYRAPRLDLFYRDPYVYEMFRDWDAYNGAEKVFSSLAVEIKDPALAAGEITPAPTPADWQTTDLFILHPDVAVINNMLENGDPCVDTEPAEPIAVETVFNLPDLLPLKAYAAIFTARYRRASDNTPSVREVHRYVFQTSRYPDFAAQVDSWRVAQTAVYELAVDLDGDGFTAASALVADPGGASSELSQRFADPFDRLIDGILRLGALAPAVTTEFNVVRLRGSGRVLGILVRNPEPFNDPKIPRATLQTTLSLAVDGGDPALFVGLHAKDAARVFLTNADGSLAIPPGALHLTFRYQRFDGSAYTTVATATVDFDLS